jgi:hypothetical protein
METVARNVVQYLIKRKLLTQKALVDGGMVLSVQRSRNRFISLKQKNGTSYFIKQALETEMMTSVTVAREAAIYQGAFGDDRLEPLKKLLPRFYLFEPKDSVLVTELVSDSTSLASIAVQPTGPCSPEVAAKVGTAIGAYHQIRFATDKPQAALFPQESPWILKLHTQKNLGHLHRSPACSALVNLLLNAPGLAAHLAAVEASWERDTLIHSDLKWENCLLSPIRAPAAEQRLHIIDWELADIGDSAWDVGSIFQSYLNLWIGSMTPRPGASIDDLAASASTPIDVVQRAIAIFWEAYAGQAANYLPVTREFLLRSTTMMASRMLVTAFEASLRSTELDPRAVLMVQTAMNILEHPAKSVHNLLSLGDHHDAIA